jgi:Zn-dependent metalloprotease
VAAVVADAVSLWEEGTGRDLFVPVASTSRPDVMVNFVFDDRHERTLAESSLSSTLEEKESSAESLQSQYEELAESYREKRTALETRVARYEADLDRHNETVESYNSEGGAPEDVYATLQREEARLSREAESIEKATADLNTLADQVNALGERGSQLIRQYNSGVATYNDRFGDADEFTQGDYQDGVINIYTFISKGELVNILAHELGHALDIEHVEGSDSVMYYLMEDQPTPPALSAADQTGFLAVCGQPQGFGTQVRALINKYF